MKYRSVLFVPGHEEKKIQKAYTLDADIVVIDLESTVPKDQKENAKKIIKDCKVNKQKTYIRIDNNNDLDFVTNEEFIGIFLPFTESKGQLSNIDKILKSNEKINTDIIPIIESEKGLKNLKEICEFKERIKHKAIFFISILLLVLIAFFIINSSWSNMLISVSYTHLTLPTKRIV